MTVRFPNALIAALVLLAASLPAGAASSAPIATAQPNSAIGPMVCSAFMAERNKLFLAWGFSAAGSRSTELALAYAQMLREQRYAAASMYAPAGSPPPELTVDCRWHATQAQADEFKEKLVAGAERNRITYVPTKFNPL